MTPELARVLKHELAHSFITQLSGGRCPPWLHEGIAQFLEPRSLGGNGHQLSHLYKAQREIPLNALEGSFQNFSGAQAYVAYAESLAAVSYINDSYGMSEYNASWNASARAVPPKPPCVQPSTPTTASSKLTSPNTCPTNTANNRMHKLGRGQLPSAVHRALDP